MQLHWPEGFDWQEIAASPLIEQALTHPSCALKTGDLPHNNQRLEFLGDAVLGLVITEMLYGLYPNEQEGELARRLSGLVCGTSVVAIAREIGIGEALLLSDSEEENDGRTNPSNLEDACEALIGAIYLAAGLEAARFFIHHYWRDLALSVSEPPKDPKTRLQEWAQAQALPLPAYRLVEESGPSHAPTFVMEVSVSGQGTAQAAASSKKLAERLAAEELMGKLA